jgi:hypothetical protein
LIENPALLLKKYAWMAKAVVYKSSHLDPEAAYG